MEKEMGCIICNWRGVPPRVHGETIRCVRHVPLERVIAATDCLLSRTTMAQSHG